jgi:hypothetical protein
MDLVPLLKVIFETAWYTTWKYHWWFPVCAMIAMVLLSWAMGAGFTGLVIVALLTAILSPFVYLIGEYLLIRLR